MTHVLVVDDEPALRRTVTMNLTSRGYQVSSVGTGAEALQLVATGAPDLMLLDLGLPDIDGTEVIRQLRQRGDDLPIIVISARATSEVKGTVLDLGATDYITKPFDISELLARLRVSVSPPQHRTMSSPRPSSRAQPTDLIHLLAGRWIVSVLDELSTTSCRYNDLHNALEGISHKVLTETLRRAERAGLIRRQIDSGRIETATVYQLTDLGASLAEPLGSLQRWTDRYWSQVLAARDEWERRHAAR